MSTIVPIRRGPMVIVVVIVMMVIMAAAIRHHQAARQRKNAQEYGEDQPAMGHKQKLLGHDG